MGDRFSIHSHHALFIFDIFDVCYKIKSNMRKIRVAVLMGGPSSEHEVSLMSGRTVCENLDLSRYEVLPVHIDKAGEWNLPFEHVLDNSDIAFIALHGEYGEDGRVQDFLETLGLPYTGSSAHSSALGMNKAASSRLFRAYGLDIPEFNDIARHGDWAYFKADFGYPVVVKPADRGSSVGVNIVRNEDGLRDAICNVFDISRHAMVQKYISGREITCAVIEDEKGVLPLPPTEIIPKGASFFDYESKYSSGASHEITPAPLERNITLEVQRIAVAAHRIINASGASRTDMIIGNDGRIYVLEINTIPGMTSTSLLPQAAAAHGLGMDRLLDHIIASAIRRFGM